jgi:hypothetical protein
LLNLVCISLGIIVLFPDPTQIQMLLLMHGQQWEMLLSQLLQMIPLFLRLFQTRFRLLYPKAHLDPWDWQMKDTLVRLEISEDVALPHIPEGIKVEEGTTYNASFYYRFPSATDFAGTITATLQSASGDALASSSVDVSGDASGWQKAELFLTANATPDSVDNLFTVTLDGAEASGVTANFALFSLFPPTFKNRPNGMRADIAQV